MYELEGPERRTGSRQITPQGVGSRLCGACHQASPSPILPCNHVTTSPTMASHRLWTFPHPNRATQEKAEVTASAAAAAAQAQASLAAGAARLAALEEEAADAWAARETAAVELREYKARAHALLARKDAELAGAAAAAREEGSAALAEAELRAERAEAAALAAREAAAAAREAAGAELAAEREATGAELARLRASLHEAVDAGEAARRAYAQLRLRYESLELRAAAAARELDEARAGADAAADAARRLERSEAELASTREGAAAARAELETRVADLSERLEAEAREAAALRAAAAPGRATANGEARGIGSEAGEAPAWSLEPDGSAGGGSWHLYVEVQGWGWRGEGVTEGRGKEAAKGMQLPCGRRSLPPCSPSNRAAPHCRPVFCAGGPRKADGAARGAAGLAAPCGRAGKGERVGVVAGNLFGIVAGGS